MNINISEEIVTPLKEIDKMSEDNYKEKHIEKHGEEPNMKNNEEQDRVNSEEESTTTYIEKTANDLLRLDETKQDDSIKVGPIAKEFTLDIPRIPSLELPLNV